MDSVCTSESGSGKDRPLPPRPTARRRAAVRAASDRPAIEPWPARSGCRSRPAHQPPEAGHLDVLAAHRHPVGRERPQPRPRRLHRTKPERRRLVDPLDGECDIELLRTGVARLARVLVGGRDRGRSDLRPSSSTRVVPSPTSGPVGRSRPRWGRSRSCAASAAGRVVARRRGRRPGRPRPRRRSPPRRTRPPGRWRTARRNPAARTLGWR